MTIHVKKAVLKSIATCQSQMIKLPATNNWKRRLHLSNGGIVDQAKFYNGYTIVTARIAAAEVNDEIIVRILDIISIRV